MLAADEMPNLTHRVLPYEWWCLELVATPTIHVCARL